jgi:DNA-binding transcriptional ArsR family regulator
MTHVSAPQEARRSARRAAEGSKGGDLCEVRCVDELKVRRTQKVMKPARAITDLAETFKVLGDPTRLRIAYALAQEELCVCDLATVLGVSQSVVSHSLRALRQMRLVRYRKAGKIAYYSLDDDHISSMLGEGFRHVEEEA